MFVNVFVTDLKDKQLNFKCTQWPETHLNNNLFPNMEERHDLLWSFHYYSTGQIQLHGQNKKLEEKAYTNKETEYFRKWQLMAFCVSINNK